MSVFCYVSKHHWKEKWTGFPIDSFDSKSQEEVNVNLLSNLDVMKNNGLL